VTAESLIVGADKAEDAVQDFTTALDIRKELLPCESPELADVHIMLSSAYISLANEGKGASAPLVSVAWLTRTDAAMRARS
jgi:hypothetical protein